MIKYRVAFVVQRYGTEVNGGAELHCRLIAELMKDVWDINVLTTCALDYMTWANYYPAGKTKINDITIFRFPIKKPRNIKKFNKLSEKVFNRSHTTQDEYKWMTAQGPNSPDLTQYIEQNLSTYDVFIFFTYLYATTFFSLPKASDKALLVPTAHDEPPIYLSIFKHFFKLPRGYIFNTPEEKQFLIQQFNIDCSISDIIGVGPKTCKIIDSVDNDVKLPGNYIIYVGRVDASKGCKTLFEYWIQYKKNNDNDLNLLLVGGHQMDVPGRDDIISLGFAEEGVKIKAIKHSKCLVMPSLYESLSIVLLEAWFYERPVLVNGKCSVLKNQCRRSNGGLWYTNYDEFEACLNYTLDNDEMAKKMGFNGKKYTEENYNWDVIRKKYSKLLENIVNFCKI